MQVSIVIALATLLLAQISTAQENKQKPAFGSCKVAEAYKSKYESFGVKNPDSFYACDASVDYSADLAANYKYQNFDEAYAQYSKDYGRGNSKPSFSDYSYPKPYDLTKDDLQSIISWSILKKNPNTFKSLGANDQGVVFVYNDGSKWINKDVVTFWYLTSFFYTQQRQSTFPHDSAKSQLAINCQRGTYALIQQILYSGFDDSGGSYTVLKSEISKEKFFDIAPNTLHVTLQKEFCQKSKSPADKRTS
jgi:hypothetical protein